MGETRGDTPGTTSEADAGRRDLSSSGEDRRGKPTAAGIAKYTDGYYEGIACTCKDDCGYTCKGECGCSACSSAYGDFLSCE